MFILAIMIVLKESEFDSFLSFREEIRKSKIKHQKLDQFEQKLTYKFKIIIPMRFLVFELLKNLKLNFQYNNYDSFASFDLMILKKVENVNIYKKPLFRKKRYVSQYYQLSYITIGRVLFHKKDKDTVVESKVTLQVFHKKYNASLMKISKLLTEYCNTVHTFQTHNNERDVIFKVNNLTDDYVIENETFLNSNHYKDSSPEFKEAEYDDYDDHYYY